MENFYSIINLIIAGVGCATPLLLATTGEILNEKSGSLNLGVEGIMAVGAIFGFLAGANASNLFVAVLVSFIASACCGLLYAFLTVTLKANQNVTGLSMTIFGLGFAEFIGKSLKSLGSYPVLKSAFKKDLLNNGIPGLEKIPVIGDLLFKYDPIVYLAIAIAIIAWIYMFKTKTGLKMRALGENPAAADSVGVNVSKLRYLNICVGCGLMGIGGMYISLISRTGAWADNWINGYGWIAVALVIFVKWSPARAIGGSFLFGLFLALHSNAGNIAFAYPTVFGWLAKVPVEVFKMLPYIITSLAIIIDSISKKKEGVQPSACGLNYYREDR